MLHGRNHSIVMFCEINEGRKEGRKAGYRLLTCAQFVITHY